MHRCGRREPWVPDSPFVYDQVEHGDHWRADGTCSYCGSLNPVTLLARLRAGDVELSPTDKSYKVYVRNMGGQPFKRSYRNCSPSICPLGPDACTHWVTESVEQAKFYFQHFDATQQHEFIALYNTGKVKIGYPGYFYVRPFFCSPADSGVV